MPSAGSSWRTPVEAFEFVERRDQIIYFGVILERLKAVGKSQGHIELMTICSR